MQQFKYSVQVGDYHHKYAIERVSGAFYKYWDHVCDGESFPEYFFMNPHNREGYARRFNIPSHAKLDNRFWFDMNELYCGYNCNWSNKVFIQQINEKGSNGGWYDFTNGIHELYHPEMLPPSQRKGYYTFGYTIEKGMVEFSQINSKEPSFSDSGLIIGLNLQERFDPKKLWVETQELFAGKYLVVRMEYRISKEKRIFLNPKLETFKGIKKGCYANVVGRPTGNEFLCAESLKNKNIPSRTQNPTNVNIVND